MAIEIADGGKKPVGKLLLGAYDIGSHELLETVAISIGVVERGVRRGKASNVGTLGVEVVELGAEIIFEVHSPNLVIEIQLDDMHALANFLCSGKDVPFAFGSSLIDWAPF